MNDGIDSLLTRLPEPEPPTTLSASIMARVEREADRPATATRAFSREMNNRHAPAWTWAVLGIAVVTGLTVYGWLTKVNPPDVISSRIGLGRLERMPVDAVHVLLLATGLWLFLAGLFAPLARRERRPARVRAATVSGTR